MDRPGGYTAEEEAILAMIRERETSLDDLAEAINKLPDPQRAFDLATKLREVESQAPGRIAEIRAQQAHRIYESAEMSLTELGRRVGGLTKQRALKMLQTAAKAQEDDDE